MIDWDLNVTTGTYNANFKNINHKEKRSISVIKVFFFFLDKKGELTNKRKAKTKTPTRYLLLKLGF